MLPVWMEFPSAFTELRQFSSSSKSTIFLLPQTPMAFDVCRSHQKSENAQWSKGHMTKCTKSIVSSCWLHACTMYVDINDHFCLKLTLALCPVWPWREKVILYHIKYVDEMDAFCLRELPLNGAEYLFWA